MEAAAILDEKKKKISLVSKQAVALMVWNLILKTMNHQSNDSPSHLICIHNLHDTFFEELRIHFAGDGGSFLHQAQLSVFLHRHGVGDHGADVNLEGQDANQSEAASTPLNSDALQLLYLLQTLGGECVIPALHVLAGKFVLAEHSHSLAFFAPSNGLDHLVKVAFVAFILQVTHGKTNRLQEAGMMMNVLREEQNHLALSLI